MKSSGNPKEIFIDGKELSMGFNIPDPFLDFSNPNKDVFLFHCCCKNLERVSLLNVIWFITEGWVFSPTTEIVQRILIKFIRNALSLRWFPSQLTPENMAMLRLEHPGIKLLN